MSLLHPYIPFISEEVWQSFKNSDEDSIVISCWPKTKIELKTKSAENDMQFLQDAISALRNIRAEMNVPPGKMAHLYIRADNQTMDQITKYSIYFKSLAKIESISHYSENLADLATASAVVGGAEFFLPLAELIDLDKEKARLEKEIQRLQGLTKNISNKLSNESFIKKAPEKVVKAEKEKFDKIKESLEKVENNYKNLVRK
jgi:valyl-tRNA synthetase